MVSKPRARGHILAIAQLRRGDRLVGKVFFTLNARILPHDEAGAAAGAARHDNEFLAARFDIAIDSGPGADKSGSNGIAEEGLDGRRPGIESDPMEPRAG